MVDLGPEGEVLVDGKQVGKLVYDRNHLEKIEIEHQYQGNGYGTEAIKIWLGRVRENGFGRVTTTLVTSDAAAHILEKLGFETIKEPSDYDFLDKYPEGQHQGCYVKELEDSGDG